MARKISNKVIYGNNCSNKRNDVISGKIKTRGATRRDVLHFLQLNCHHSKVCSGLVCKYVEKFDPIIALITEPWINGGKVQGLTGGDKYFANGARATIMCRGVKSWPLPHLNTKDMVAANVIWSKNRITLASVYWDIKKDDLPEGLSEVAKIKDTPIIIGMDTNAHSALWGCPDTNSRGETLEEFIIHNDLYVANVGTQVTFSSPIGQSIIDVTLVNKKAWEMINDWKVEKEVEMGSDHLPITFKIIGEKELTFSRNLKKVEWGKFRCELEKVHWAEPEAWSCQLIDSEANEITKTIKQVLDKVAPERERKSKNMSLTWWTEGLKNLRQRMKKARGKNERYKQLKKMFKKELDAKKKQNWQEWVGRLEGYKDTEKFLKVARKDDAIKLGVVKKPGGGYTITREETMDVLLAEHFPGSLESQDEVQQRHTSSIRTRELENGWINGNLVQEALASFGDNKSAGPDGLKPIVLKNITAKMNERIAKLYRAILATGYTPRDWCESKVVFIPKPGKKDYTERRSFRPISLTNFLFKGLERIVSWKMEVDEQGRTNKRQHAFQRGKSTDSALAEVVGHIEKAMANKESVLAVFLDIEGAFDNIDLTKAKEEMIKHQIPRQFREWYSNYLESRRCTAEGRTRHLTKGTPQGGVLSPKIWNLIFDGLMEQYDSGPIKITGFADDGVLLLQGKVLSCMTDIMTNGVKKALNWGTKSGLKFSKDKTNVILFSKSTICRKQKEKYKVKMEGIDLDYSSEAKYLGLILDDRLNFTKHIKSKVNKAKKLMAACKRCAGIVWGPKPKVIDYIYKGIVRPMVTYGSAVWHKAAMKKTNKNELGKLQRLAMTCMAQVKRSTPGSAMEVLLDIPPLHLHVEEAARKTKMRLQGKEWDKMEKTLSLQRNVKKTFTGKDSGEGLRIFTDGSKTKHGVGASFVVMRKEQIVYQEVYKLDQHCSVFQAEVLALGKAGEYIRRENINDVVINSDSQAAIQAVTGMFFTSKVAIKAHNVLNKIDKVTLNWIKAHVGWAGNERADILAKAGAKGGGRDGGVQPPGKKWNREIETEIRKMWRKEWKECDIKGGKDFIPSPNGKWNKEVNMQNREGLGKIIRIITGHSYLRGGIWQAQDKETRNRTREAGLCRKCKEEKETAGHLVARCPALAYQRWQWLGRAFVNNMGEENPGLIWGYLADIGAIKWEKDGMKKEGWLS